MPAITTHHFSSEILIKTCPLPSSMISRKGNPLPQVHHHDHHDRHDRLQRSLTVTATAIEPLSALIKRNKKHLEYNVMERLIESIGHQLQGLERENKGISTFHLDDITAFHVTTEDATTVIYFAITNDEHIHDINEDNNIVITGPYSSSRSITTKASSTPPFYSPEFKEFLAKKTLPYEIHFKSGHYSFGLLCLYCYVSRSAAAAPLDTATTTLDTATTLDTTLDPIINTKIYWFLKQVLQKDPRERRFLCA